MKTLILFLLSASLLWSTESEPNDSREQADHLANGVIEMTNTTAFLDTDYFVIQPEQSLDGIAYLTLGYLHSSLIDSLSGHVSLIVTNADDDILVATTDQTFIDDGANEKKLIFPISEGNRYYLKITSTERQTYRLSGSIPLHGYGTEEPLRETAISFLTQKFGNDYSGYQADDTASCLGPNGQIFTTILGTTGTIPDYRNILLSRSKNATWTGASSLSFSDNQSQPTLRYQREHGFLLTARRDSRINFYRSPDQKTWTTTSVQIRDQRPGDLSVEFASDGSLVASYRDGNRYQLINFTENSTDRITLPMRNTTPNYWPLRLLKDPVTGSLFTISLADSSASTNYSGPVLRKITPDQGSIETSETASYDGDDQISSSFTATIGRSGQTHVITSRANLNGIRSYFHYLREANQNKFISRGIIHETISNFPIAVEELSNGTLIVYLKNSIGNLSIILNRPTTNIWTTPRPILTNGERYQKLNPVKNTDGLILGFSAVTTEGAPTFLPTFDLANPDGDSLTNLEESTFGTNPLIPDQRMRPTLIVPNRPPRLAQIDLIHHLALERQDTGIYRNGKLKLTLKLGTELDTLSNNLLLNQVAGESPYSSDLQITRISPPFNIQELRRLFFQYEISRDR